MKLFKKIFQSAKLATSLNQIYPMICDLETKINNGKTADDLGEDILVIAYICRKGIIDRIEELNYPMTNMLYLNNIAKGKITAFLAYHNTVVKFQSLMEQINFTTEIEEILNKNEAFYQVERLLPMKIKNQI